MKTYVITFYRTTSAGVVLTNDIYHSIVKAGNVETAITQVAAQSPFGNITVQSIYSEDIDH